MKKRLPITPQGATLAGGSAALCAGGLLAADGLLLVLGSCGILVLALAWLSGKNNLRKLDATLHTPGRVAAGVPFELELTLHNRRPLLDAFQTGADLTLPGETHIRATARWTAARSASRITLPATIPGRGFATTHPLTLTSTFPLGLFSHQRQLNIRHRLTITPRPITPLELSSHGSLHDTLPHNGLTTGQSSGEPRGIRPWQAGDSARHIHWPASARSLARGHSLRTRECDPPGFHPDHCHIVFHSYATGREMLREDRFERALSLLAGSLLELQKKNIPCTLICDFQDWQPATCHTRKQTIDFLNTLAHAQRNPGTEAHDLELTLHNIPPEHTLMILSDMIPDSWQHLLCKHPQTLVIDIRQVFYQKRTMQTAV